MSYIIFYCDASKHLKKVSDSSKKKPDFKKFEFVYQRYLIPSLDYML